MATLSESLAPTIGYRTENIWAPDQAIGGGGVLDARVISQSA